MTNPFKTMPFREYMLWFVCLALLIMVIGMADKHVQAAQPAPPTVEPCQLVNTATFSNGAVIEVALCTPDGSAPYLLDSFGFMKSVEE